MPIAPEIAAKIPLFKDFDTLSLDKVSNLMSSRTYLSHDIVMRKGEAAENLAFLLSGKLQVVDLSEEGKEIGIHFILPITYFGELSVIDGQPRSASVISVTLSEVAFLPSNHARELIFHHPLIAKRLLTHFAQVVRNASNQRTLLSIPSAFQRVFAQLQTFVRDSKDGQIIEGLPKQHEIAIMVNTSRETVSRAIHTLMKMNIVEKQGTILIVKKPEQLKHVATVGVDEGNSKNK